MDRSPGAAPMFPEVTLDDIRAAAERIKGAVARTPSHWSRTLSQIAGCDIHLKFENLHFTSSFKERGALNKLLSLSPEERRRGVAAMSAGNHAQGVAYHAGRLGIPATIVMPEGTPYNKIKHTKNFGARVVLDGVTLEQAFDRAQKIASEEHLAFIHPYEDARVVAGQGTVALELLEAAPELDAIVAPIGGGGLITGIALGAKALKPEIEIYGAEAEVCPSMYDTLKGAALPCSVQTIAEGIAVKKAGDLARRVLAAFAKDVLLVREDQIESAIVTLLEVEKTVVEGAGATALAAVLGHPQIFRGRKVGVILSGGNIEMRLLSNVILRELSREGRILSVVVKIEDRPGLLARIATIVSETGGNILEVSHNRMLTDMTAKSADLGLTIEARDAGHAREIREKLESAGFVLRPDANV
ncbi:MAG TPA: threonine ammonia-lyase [Rhizomicrobium sp.]|jgi:threonine dehydratase